MDTINIIGCNDKGENFPTAPPSQTSFFFHIIYKRFFVESDLYKIKIHYA